MRIIAVGDQPLKKFWRYIREKYKLIDYIYPEFFDAKKELIIQKDYRSYLRKLMKKKSEVYIAIWPDHYYDLGCKSTIFKGIRIVFPMHYKRELDFVLKLDPDFVGMPNESRLRDYSIYWFIEQVKKQYGFKIWLLGYKPKFRYYIYHFDATDITGVSFRGITFDKLKNVLAHEKEIVNQLKEIKYSYGNTYTIDTWY